MVKGGVEVEEGGEVVVGEVVGHGWLWQGGQLLHYVHNLRISSSIRSPNEKRKESGNDAGGAG